MNWLNGLAFDNVIPDLTRFKKAVIQPHKDKQVKANKEKDN